MVSITLKIPTGLDPASPINNIAVPNTATAVSDSADTVASTANVTVAIPITVDTTVGKTWAPASEQFAPGTASTVTLMSGNTSNVPAASLALQDPDAAADDATTLTAANPFTIVDFAGFGTVTAPQGANQVQVDAYVFDMISGKWAWKTGPPSTIGAIALPDGVANADVGGLRFTFTDAASGATIVPAGTQGSVPVNVTQRATNRNTGAGLIVGTTVTNKVAGTVTVPGRPPVTKTATAPYAITPLTVSVQAGKAITPARIPAGTSATASVTGKNTSNGPLTSLTLSDTGYFTDKLGFGGFTTPISYPTGATAATVTWFFSDGSSSQAAVAAGATPIAPSPPAGEHLTGFAVAFTGAIAAGVTATINFSISPAADVAAASSPVQFPNTVVVTGVNAAGSATANKQAPLAVFRPDISLTIDKTISPVGAVTPGGTVVVKLPTTTSTDSAFVNPSTIVVEDDWRSSTTNDFWNAFDPIAVAPTQIPAGAGLVVTYVAGGATKTLDTVTASASPQLFQEAFPTADLGSITSVTYTFTNPAGFGQGATVTPNTIFQARATLRDDPGTTTSVAGDPATDFHNLGGAQGTGTVAGDVVVTSLKVTDLADASIISFPGGDGGIVAGKKWQNTAFSADVTSLDSQSGEQAGTRLTWGVLSTGYDSVTIADPATGEATPKNTAFEAFDLMAVSPISFTQDPQLKYDQVSAVELYNGTTWVPVTAPGGSWMNGTGFKGYTLTGAQSASTTGVRLVITPNDAARTGSSDPLTPPVGSGVGSSAVDSTGQTSRFFGLVWQLRNTVRVATGNPSPWATATHGFNDADPATIANAVGVSGERGGTPVTQVTATDKVSLLDVPPGVDVAKTASAATVVIPNDGDVASGIYPKITFTVTGQNTSLARASYLRVTDPMPCSAFAVGGCTSTPTGWDDNPFTTAPYTTDNPFERVNLTQIAFTVNAGQIDTAASNVILWHRSATGVLTTTTTTMATAAAMTEAQLQDVVGVSVVYQGTDPTVNGGTITSGAKPVMTLTTQARVYQRSDTTQLVKPFTIENYAFSQSYDPVLTPSGTASTPVDSANANVTLVDGTLDVTASKVFSPTTILEKNRANPISMTLGATQGGSTVATNEVTMEDSDQHFWSTFRLVSLGSVTPPVGSDQVRVDVQTNGSATWQLGSFAAQAALPAVDLTTVSGIRFIFNRLDNGVFSHSSPPANWSAQAVLSVALLDTLRGTATPVPFPTTVTNELKNSSQRFEDPAIYASASKQTAADLTLDPGSFALDVAKAPLNDLHTVEAGVSVPWTLKFTNAGTGYLNLSDIVDQLPPYLTFDLVDPTYSKSAGSTLSTGVTYTYDAPTKTVTFSWPNGGNRMAPGDTFTITLGIILEPGLTSSQTATNQFIVDTTQDLTSCVNSSGNGQSVLSGLGSKQCGTSNYVQPIAGASLVTFKGVRGDIGGTLVSGAVNTSNPAAPCVGDVGGFYRTPCAANTVVGGTDEWKLQAINSGTVDYTKLTLVEPLPFAGDRMLATGSDRGSTYRPVFDVAHGLDVTGLPTGTGFTWQVTTAADVCVGAGSISAWAGAPPGTPADPTCAAHPVAASWTDGATFTGNWADVTGLRIVLDFTASTPHVLAPGGGVDIRYRTVNAPTSSALPGRAPIAVPVTGSFAWNQFGATAVLSSGAVISRAPVKAGVTIVGGPLQVTKVVTGAAASSAPAEFLVDLACTIGGVPLSLGADSVLELNAGNSFAARVNGIPLGSSCLATEQGAVGRFGESSRTGSPSTIAVTQTVDALTPVPAAQQATITNDYAYGALSVTKKVATLATVGVFGPFDFTLSCVTAIGSAITLPVGDRTFSLAADEVHTVTANTLPIGARCTLTETDAKNADSTVSTGTGVTDAGNGVANITVAAATAATVTNTFEAGTLSVLKTVDGSGAGDYGTGPFTASVHCTYGTPAQVLYDNTALPIVPATPALVPVVFPVGTQCAVQEVKTGGANSHDDPPLVTITGPTGGQTVGAVTADITNHFLVGKLALEKVRTGTTDAIAKFGAGPFAAHVDCTWDSDGATITVPLPAGGDVTLDAAGNYTATLDGIIVGASCAVTETDAGFATSSTLTPTSGIVTVLDPATNQTPATVVITNHFEVGQLEIKKTVTSAVALTSSDVSYDITVSNVGHIDAHNVDVRDVLPAGAKVVSAESPGVLGNGVVTWTIPDLLVGEQTSFTIVLRYGSAGSYVNRAELPTLPGPWDPSVVDNACATGSPDDSCASVVIATLPFTGASVGWAGAFGGLLVGGGFALWLLGAWRRRYGVRV